VQPHAELLAEEFMKTHNDISVEVQGGGSAVGIKAAEDGITDIGMSSRNLKESENGLWQLEIAKDGLAIIVNPKNPILGLNAAQIRDIYTGKVKKWIDLDYTGMYTNEFDVNKEIDVITREEGSGTRSAFQELVMENGAYKITPAAIVQNSNGSIYQLVKSDENAIGFISLGLVDDKVKALQVDNVDATVENIENGTYKFYRPFLFVAKEKPDGAAWVFIEYIFSDDGQTLLRNDGLIPVSLGIRG